jgi:hypothetical protein
MIGMGRAAHPRADPAARRDRPPIPLGLDRRRHAAVDHDVEAMQGILRRGRRRTFTGPPAGRRTVSPGPRPSTVNVNIGPFVTNVRPA